MSSEYLSDFIENAELDLDLLIPGGMRGELDFDGVQKLCDRFRQRGVCGFLLSGEGEPFFVNAMQSAGAYVACTKRIDDSQKVTSDARPFYDSVGCGFWDCARTIARSSRTTWNPAKEYEDDFLFVTFLMKHFFLDAGDAECRALISEHERVAEGKDQVHRDVCLAFLEKDGALLDESLREILATRAQRVEAMVGRNAIPEEHWSWLRYFSSEGLALVKLADRAELPIGSDYLHVSEILREGPTFEFTANAWHDLLFRNAPVNSRPR